MTLGDAARIRAAAYGTENRESAINDYDNATYLVDKIWRLMHGGHLNCDAGQLLLECVYEHYDRAEVQTDA